VDQNVVWASGSNGTVLRTIDGGAHWETLIVPGAADFDFRDVQGIDAKTAYVLSIGEAEKSRIYKTVDGGGTWKAQFTNRDPKAFFDGFAFWDASSGIAFSDPVDGRFLIIHTTDGGASWKEIPRENIPPALPDEAAFAASGTSIAVAGKDHAWIATGGSAARVFHSSDRGLTWSVSNTPVSSGAASAGIFSIYAPSTQSVYVVGGDYKKEKEPGSNFAKSIDGGRTWVLGPSLPGYRSAVTGISRENPGLLIAVGPSGSNFMTSKAEWISVGTVGYDAISFLPGLAIGWAVGEAGRIARWQGIP
jgi:photosystem II stability/assembly factor-like uncharacterized protein